PERQQRHRAARQHLRVLHRRHRRCGQGHGRDSIPVRARTVGDRTPDQPAGDRHQRQRAGELGVVPSEDHPDPLATMTRKDVAWWIGVCVVLAELTAIAAYPDEAVTIVRNVYLTCWKYLPLP